MFPLLWYIFENFDIQCFKMPQEDRHDHITFFLLSWEFRASLQRRALWWLQSHLVPLDSFPQLFAEASWLWSCFPLCITAIGFYFSHFCKNNLNRFWYNTYRGCQTTGKLVSPKIFCSLPGKAFIKQEGWSQADSVYLRHFSVICLSERGVLFFDWM